jgi:hypothetical protein
MALAPQPTAIEWIVLSVDPEVNNGARPTFPVAATTSAVAGAATASAQRGKVTSEALTTAAGADYTLVVTDDVVIDTDGVAVASVRNGTNTQGTPSVIRAWCSAVGQLTIVVRNVHASQAFNGTIVINFVLFP